MCNMCVRFSEKRANETEFGDHIPYLYTMRAICNAKYTVVNKIDFGVAVSSVVRERDINAKTFVCMNLVENLYYVFVRSSVLHNGEGVLFNFK